MDYRSFSNQIENKVNMMNKSELIEFILEMIRHVPEKLRENVIEGLVGNDTIGDVKELNINKEYQRVMSMCEAIANNDKYLIATYYEGDGYHYCGYEGEYDDEAQYDDPDGVEEDIRDILSVADWLLNKKEYKYTEDILDMISTLEILVNYEDFDEEYFYTIDELVDDDTFSIDIRDISIKALYVVYMITDKEERPERLYRHYGWYSNKLVRLDELITMGPERLPDFNEFVSGWIELLKTKSGDMVEALLEDAFTYLEGKDALEKYAKELCDKFPRYYVHWFQELLERKDYEKLMVEAELAFKSIANVSPERYLIGNIVYVASKKIENKEMMHRSSMVIYEANPCVKTYLRLKTLPMKEELCKDIEISTITNLKSDTNEFDSMLFEVLNGKYNDIWKKVSKNKKVLGWSMDPKGIIVPFFLLMLVEVSQISPLMERILLEIQHRIEYKKHMDDQDLIDYYKLWRGFVKIPEGDRDKLFNWCQSEVNERVKAIVSNKYRNAYKRAAEISLLLSEVAFCIGKTGRMDEIALQHQAMFPRHSAFKGEYRDLL